MFVTVKPRSASTSCSQLLNNTSLPFTKFMVNRVLFADSITPLPSRQSIICLNTLLPCACVGSTITETPFFSSENFITITIARILFPHCRLAFTIKRFPLFLLPSIASNTSLCQGSRSGSIISLAIVFLITSEFYSKGRILRCYLY